MSQPPTPTNPSKLFLDHHTAQSTSYQFSLRLYTFFFFGANITALQTGNSKKQNLSFSAPKTLQLLFCFVVNFMCIVIIDMRSAALRPQVMMLIPSIFFLLCLLSKA